MYKMNTIVLSDFIQFGCPGSHPIFSDPRFKRTSRFWKIWNPVSGFWQCYSEPAQNGGYYTLNSLTRTLTGPNYEVNTSHKSRIISAMERAHALLFWLISCKSSSINIFTCIFAQKRLIYLPTHHAEAPDSH